MHGENAERDVAHVRQLFVGGDVARPDQLDARLVEPEVGEVLHHRGRRLAGRNEHHQAVGLRVLHALHIGRPVGVLQRHAHLAEDLAAAGGERLLECFLGVVARAEVGNHRVDFLGAAFLDRPGAERLVEHRRGHRRPRHIGRLGGDDRGRRIHDHGELLGFGGDVADRERVGRQDQSA